MCNLRVLKTSISILYCNRATIEVNQVKKKGMIDTVSMECILYRKNRDKPMVQSDRKVNFLHKN